MTISSGPANYDDQRDMPPNAIAVVGMGCKFPGANSVEEYWQLLESGRSMVSEPPTGRFPTQDHKRSTEKSVFFGNFLSDVSSFDNRFFKRSSREAASMDPQQRLLLEVAYQALESSGFFRPQEQDPDLEVGCFVGVCASDYNDNVASHPPNAFSTLGTLRAFLTGKISHFFGFSGPSITYDTACSSSAVAIDAACKAILHGDCTSAIAGGVSIFTSPHFYQNLAQATFLSPTGPTKPFDESADGYCRGEGVGLVVLKKLSKAIEDGDNILGTILSTAVKQSSNKVPITVPHSGSHAGLYRKVLEIANVRPEEVSYLEAHGSGTPVGDPREIEAIMDVFRSPRRETPLYISSVKGNIGHTEGASGVAGLIKTLLMLQRRAVPRQVSFQRINPKINIDTVQCRIPTSTMPWEADAPLMACINNYGAAGSIAALLVREAGKLKPTPMPVKPLSRYPILISANSPQSLADNCEKLRQHIAANPSLSLADIAFNLSEKQNRALPKRLVLTVSSLSELAEQLQATASAADDQIYSAYAEPRKVILTFGGQINRSIGLSQSVYDGSALLRKHLDECDEIVKCFGYPGIFPGIFSTTPIDDIVLLQTCQFALHYACAQSWIASGLKVDCIVGHSFGQLVALTVSGVFSLEEGLRLAYGRAVLMKEKWGPERGSMVALDADRATTLELIKTVRNKNPASALEIACFNGPRSHVVVGSTTDVQTVEEVIKTSMSIKYKVLNVTHGFHSQFCDPILSDLEALAQTLRYRSPKIPLELTSHYDSVPTAQIIAEHTRIPVDFEGAIKRIEKRLGPCTWLEAGSNTSVANIARRCVSDAAKHLFCPVDLTKDDALGNLASMTANLWTNGHHVQFWPLHRSNRGSYQLFNSPPYQFEKTKHWLDFGFEILSNPKISPTPELEESIPTPVLIKFAGFQDTARTRATFIIDPRSTEWQTLVEGHAVLQQPLCPAPLYMELVYQAGRELAAANKIDSFPYVRIEDLEIVSSLGISPDKVVQLSMLRTDHTGHKWAFSFESSSRDRINLDKASTHATGKIEVFLMEDKNALTELNRVGRLLKYQNLEEVASRREGEAVHGSIVYNVFSRVVNYHDFYKGVRHVAGNDGTAVGEIALPELQPSELLNLMSNPVAIDNFFQVAGLYTNCLSQCPEDEVYVCTQVDSVQLSPDFNNQVGKRWKVCSTSSRISEREIQNDIFAFDSSTNAVVFVAFGARFNRVRISSLTKVLSRVNQSTDTPNTCESPSAYRIAVEPRPTAIVERPATVEAKPSAHASAQVPPSIAIPMTSSPDLRLEEEVRILLSRVTDVPAESFRGDVTLTDLGIDSLMATEVVSEVEERFHISIPQDHLPDLQAFSSFSRYIISRCSGREQWYSNDQASAVTPPSSAIAVLPALSEDTTHRAEWTGGVNQLQQHDDILSRLAGLLGNHLECPASDFVRSTNLAERGLDSLLCMELMSDMEKEFGVSVDLAQLTMDSNYGELAEILLNAVAPGFPAASTPGSTQIGTPPPVILTPAAESIVAAKLDTFFPKTTSHTVSEPDFSYATEAFESIKHEFDELAASHQFTGFYDKVFERESQLVLAYTVETFEALGIDLGKLKTGMEIPTLRVLAKFSQLRDALYDVLQDGKLIDYDGQNYFRSEVPINTTSSKALLDEIVKDFPQFTTDHKLLHLCGANLPNLLSGAKDPVSHLFGSKKNRDILESFYGSSPSYVTMSQLLTSFLKKTLGKVTPASPDGKFQIVEIGAGTGATTKWVVDGLTKMGIPFEYTFTDISAALVAGGKRKFSNYSCMKYTTINIEKEPPAELQGKFDIVLSTNCIHATKDLGNSFRNINKLLQPQGFVSVVEFTKRLYWFDIVFGLLDGWWMFDDGRPYVLTCPEFWDERMKQSGFGHVSWTGGSSPESNLVRIITGFKQVVDEPHLYRSIPQETTGGIETLVFKYTDKNLPLRADIHYPSRSLAACHKAWNVGLMIHGGGHVMLSRKDVRPRQTELLLQQGILPVSIDYRLCPETTIVDGPIVDVADGYAWVRKTLPRLKLKHSSIQIDSSRVVVVGWSTGGTLAMSLGFTSVPRGLPAPDGILAFYCPTDYEDEFWQKPNIPDHSEAYSHDSFNILESVRHTPITAYNPPRELMAAGGWMTPKDARSRLILHMNWHGQALPILFNGLPPSDTVTETERTQFAQMKQPSREMIAKASPYSQIVQGNYRSPTYIVFGTKDDLIPWQQAQKTADALRAAGIESGITLVPDQPHLFDMYRDPDGKRWEAVLSGYKFLLARIGKKLA
ncbi:hypothetical protein F5Y08DRAFT_350345 [Xylaria arbuscula]|nr:hypothetical protein F5Y08DRAFT_350345 [Xylaria arbuscula]